MNKENISLEALLNLAVVSNDIHVVKFFKNAGINLFNIDKESIAKILQKNSLDMIAFLMEEKIITINNFSLSNFDMIEPSKMNVDIVKIMQRNGADITLVPPQVINNLIKEDAFETAFYILKEQEFIKLQKKHNPNITPILHIYEEMENCAKNQEINKLINFIEITGFSETLSANEEIVELLKNEDYQGLVNIITSHNKKDILNKKICEMVEKNDLEGLAILVNEGAPLKDAFYMSIEKKLNPICMYLLNERADLYIDLEYAMDLATKHSNGNIHSALKKKVK